VLAVCGGGVSDALAWLIILAAISVWIAGTALIVRSARDKREKRLLIALLISSIVIGPALTAAYYGDLFGNDSGTGKLALLLTIPGAIGAGIASATRAAHGFRAFLISTWGAVFLLGLTFVAIFAALGVGTGCLN
jgi:CDP-diglyceride synthetase